MKYSKTIQIDQYWIGVLAFDEKSHVQVDVSITKPNNSTPISQSELSLMLIDVDGHLLPARVLLPREFLIELGGIGVTACAPYSVDVQASDLLKRAVLEFKGKTLDFELYDKNPHAKPNPWYYPQ